MTKNEFFQNIDLRLKKYPKLLAPNIWQIQNAYFQAAMCVADELKSHFNRFKTDDGDFWGYGINSVSDGKEKNTNLDVEKIQYTEPLNRHRNPQCCNLAFILFKIKDYKFHYKIFSINIPIAKMNTDVGNVPLTSFESAKLKTRHYPDLPSMPDVFVELKFSNKDIPISFQIDPMLSAQIVGSLYIEKIEEFSKIALNMEEEKKNKTIFYDSIQGSVHSKQNIIYSQKEENKNDKEVSSNVLLTLIILDIFALIITSIWLYESNWDFEPIVTISGLAGGLLLLLFAKNKK